MEAIENAVVTLDGGPVEHTIRMGTIWKASNAIVIAHPEFFDEVGSSTDLPRAIDPTTQPFTTCRTRATSRKCSRRGRLGGRDTANDKAPNVVRRAHQPPGRARAWAALA